ncbi:MAG: 50S ribosomal protein L9 [Acidimicrobiales bacterium]
MRIVLRDDVSGLGKRGEVRDVSDGYARNFLLPKGLAYRSSPGLESQAEVMRKARAVKDARERAAAEEVAKTLAPRVIGMAARAGSEGRLFGSVTAAEIADAVYSQTGYEIDRRLIELDEPVKSVGMHLVPVRLHTDVKVFLQLDVSAG